MNNENKTKKITIKNSAFMSYVGNVDFTFEEALTELVDNSIEANATLIQVKLLNNNGVQSLIVTDNGDGIKEEDIEICLSLGNQNRVKSGKNEHGMGLKQTISFLLELDQTSSKENDVSYMISSKNPKSESWEIKNFDGGEDNEYKTGVNREQGTTIELVGTPKLSEFFDEQKKNTSLLKLKSYLGATYREDLFRNKTNIEIELVDGEKRFEKEQVLPVEPYYFNPTADKNSTKGLRSPLIEDLTFKNVNDPEYWVKVTFGYAPRTEDDFESLKIEEKFDNECIRGFDVNNRLRSTGPKQPSDLMFHGGRLTQYCTTVVNAGIDLKKNGKIIKSKYWSNTLFGKNAADGYSIRFRGEIEFSSKFKTLNSKNGFTKTNEFKLALDAIRCYLSYKRYSSEYKNVKEKNPFFIEKESGIFDHHLFEDTENLLQNEWLRKDDAGDAYVRSVYRNEKEMQDAIIEALQDPDKDCSNNYKLTGVQVANELFGKKMDVTIIEKLSSKRILIELKHNNHKDLSSANMAQALMYLVVNGDDFDEAWLVYDGEKSQNTKLEKITEILNEKFLNPQGKKLKILKAQDKFNIK